MSDPRFDVLGIGNAIVDIIARTDDDFLAAENLAKGSMNLIDADRAETLYATMGPATEASGGSAGNTVAGIGSLGGRGAFFGKVADDQLGQIYVHDMRAQGIHFETPLLTNGIATARSMILVTPDGERTMNTFLGACVELGPEDIDESVVAQSAITYFEGYLWDPPRAKDAFLKAADIAHRNGRKVSITLSDSFCVDRWREEFLGLIQDRTIDILFANEHELKALYQTSDFETAVELVRADCPLSAVTRSELGCLVVTRDGTEQVNAHPVNDVVDTTGAGDLFASGFLYGLARNYSMRESAELGALSAAEVISHIGPRPQARLSDLAQQSGYLSVGSIQP